MDISINYDVKLPETYRRGKWQGLILQFEDSGKPVGSIVVKGYEGSDFNRKLNNIVSVVNRSARSMNRPHIKAFKRGSEVYIINEIIGMRESVGARKVDYTKKEKNK